MNKHIWNIGIIGNFDFLPYFLPPPLIRVSERKESTIRLPNENVGILPNLAHLPHAKQAIEFAANKERENSMNNLLGFGRNSEIENIIKNANYIANPKRFDATIHNELNRYSNMQSKLSRKERRKNKSKRK